MELDIKGLRVFIAIPVNRDFPWQTTKSLIESTGALASRGVYYKFQFLTQGSQIDHDRSELARQFMLTDCNRLFWIDSDMGWEPESFLRLLALSTVMPIVGASYPTKKDPNTEFLIEIDNLEVQMNEWGCFPVLGMGLGFTVVHREVIENAGLASPKFSREGLVVPMIFRTGIDEEGVYRSEDMHFFKLCRKMGYTIHADPSIELDHIGTKAYRGKLLDALKPKIRRDPAVPGVIYPADVEGWLTQVEGSALATLAVGKTVLEIGTYKGKSAICMAQTAKAVHCIDPFDSRGISGVAGSMTHREFKRNLIRYGVNDPNKVREFIGTTSEIAPNLEAMYDLVYIDGAHDLDNIRADIFWARLLLLDGGLVAFHDYGSSAYPDVAEAVRELLGAGGELISVFETLAVVRPPCIPAIGDENGHSFASLASSGNGQSEASDAIR